MDVILLEIPTEVYGSELKSALWKLQYDKRYDPDLLKFLDVILKIDLLKIDKPLLKEIFADKDNPVHHADIQSITINKELIARCLEVQLLLDRTKIKKHLKIASFAYWEVFVSTEDYEYLIRHLALIRLAKGLFKPELTAITERIKPVVSTLPYPFWQLEVIKQLPAILSSTDSQALLSTSLEANLQDFITRGQYHEARFCVDSLAEIGHLSSQECSIQKALIFETEADRIVAEKKPNTFYPSISQRYTDGLQLILDTPGCRDAKNRLMLKLQTAQLDDAKMMVSASVSISPEIDYKKIHQMVVELNLDSFQATLQALLGLPVLPAKVIEKVATAEEEKETVIGKLFSRHVKISGKGKPIGFDDGKDAKANQIRFHHREHMIVVIKMIKNIMDIYGKPSREAAHEMLEKIKSSFVPPNRIYLYANGIGSGFQNDFIDAAHLLVPQLENSLRYIAEQHSISVTNYAKEVEFENTLGGTLEKLKQVINEDLYVELKSFLIDSNNVNFRNEILHGNMETILIYHYGFYAWWLSLKLIYQGKHFFKPIPK